MQQRPCFFLRQCLAVEHICHHKSTRPAHLTKSRLGDTTVLSKKGALLSETHLHCCVGMTWTP